MRRFFELLKKNGSIALIGLLIGLFGGFKLANAKYRGVQGAALNAQASRAAANLGANQGGTSGPGMSNQVSAVLERAKAKPNDIEVQLEAADQFLQIQRPQGALEFLQQASKINPEDPRVMTALSTAHLMLGSYGEATTWARRALGKKPDDLGAKLLLTFALIEARQNLDEAEKLLTQIEAIRPGDKILADARASLNAARTSGTPAQPQSVLQHGPDEPKPKSGGPR
jgi:tetratricopeptide (TPR) repeat protein